MWINTCLCSFSWFSCHEKLWVRYFFYFLLQSYKYFLYIFILIAPSVWVSKYLFFAKNLGNGMEILFSFRWRKQLKTWNSIKRNKTISGVSFSGLGIRGLSPEICILCDWAPLRVVEYILVEHFGAYNLIQNNIFISVTLSWDAACHGKARHVNIFLKGSTKTWEMLNIYWIFFAITLSSTCNTDGLILPSKSPNGNQ